MFRKRLQVCRTYCPHRIGEVVSHARKPGDDVIRRIKEELVRKAADEVKGVDIESIVVVGVPVKDILSVAKEKKVDLIVMGTHGRTSVPHVVIGSVAENVVRKAPCPVLAVRHA